MNDFISTTTYTASEARKKLYDLIDAAGNGTQAFEITLRGKKPVVLMSKDELESWMETIDVLNSPEEMHAIREGRKHNKTIPHEKMLAMFGLNDED